MPISEVRQLMGRTDYAVNEIAILLKPGTDGVAFRDLLKRSGVGDKAKVQTFEEGIPNGVAEVQNTFAMIGNAIGSIGLAVAAITIFIVIFINAITRRKFIGILKGIGISGETIIVAPLDGTLVRIMLIVLTTLIAGYLPSRMIVRKNTLDSILGRN